MSLCALSFHTRPVAALQWGVCVSMCVSDLQMPPVITSIVFKFKSILSD